MQQIVLTEHHQNIPRHTNHITITKGSLVSKSSHRAVFDHLQYIPRHTASTASDQKLDGKAWNEAILRAHQAAIDLMHHF